MKLKDNLDLTPYQGVQSPEEAYQNCIELSRLQRLQLRDEFSPDGVVVTMEGIEEASSVVSATQSLFHRVLGEHDHSAEAMDEVRAAEFVTESVLELLETFRGRLIVEAADSGLIDTQKLCTKLGDEPGLNVSRPGEEFEKNHHLLDELQINLYVRGDSPEQQRRRQEVARQLKRVLEIGCLLEDQLEKLTALSF